MDLSVRSVRPPNHKALAPMVGLHMLDTFPETNIFEPENGGFQEESPFPEVYFQVQAVSFREGTFPETRSR